MNQIYFSAQICGFLQESLRDNYSFEWPDDTVELTTEEVAEFYTTIAPPGMTLGSHDGRPAWVEVVRSPEEIAVENLRTATTEYAQASSNILALQEQIADSDWAGTSEEAVRDSLANWTAYRRALRAYINTGDGSQALPTFQS